jgi:hypothetical protein
MKTISYFFFYGYILLVIAAGFWGAFINPAFDHKLLFDLDVNTLNDYTRINMLSQFRFLRALELGFGIFSILFVKEIFSQQNLNRLFLITMTLGVLGRLLSIIADGWPSMLMLTFMGFELVGVIAISFYSKKIIPR